MKRTGYLSCSNDSLNKLFSNIIWKSYFRMGKRRELLAVGDYHAGRYRDCY